MHLWNSYNIAVFVVSKTYVGNVNSHSEPYLSLRIHGQEHLMSDVLMLALALGLFVSGIAYAYACEWL